MTTGGWTCSGRRGVDAQLHVHCTCTINLITGQVVKSHDLVNIWDLAGML